MDTKHFEQVVSELEELANLEVGKKRKAYTQGSEDILANFKRVSERLGLTPLQVFGVYFNKHVDSLNTYIQSPKMRQGETIESRFADLLNYLRLGYALHIESTSIIYEEKND
jgi:hypothetical protein